MKSYTFLVGSNATKSGRSPRLWNQIYSTLNLDFHMVPFDAKNLFEIEHFYKDKLSDRYCLGGCITNPWKEFFVQKTNELDIIYSHNSYNVISFRGNSLDSPNFLNSDGLGFWESYHQLLIDSHIIMIGYGGTGKSIALEALKLNIAMTILTRQPVPASKMYGKHNYISCGNYNRWVNDFHKKNSKLSIINATDAGSLAKPCELPTFLSQLFESKIEINCLVDINHTPLETSSIKLAKRYGISAYNGVLMNNNQAIIAFSFVHPEINPESVRAAIMKSQN